MKRFSFIALLFACTLAFTAPQTASAQNDIYADHSPEFWDRLERQLTRSLDSVEPFVRIEAARYIVYFEAYYGDKMHFENAAPKLLDLYEFSRAESHRVIALAALNAISDGASMQYLSQIVHRERDPLVRQVALATLADYQKRATI